MKWRDLYSGLTIRNQAYQPDCYITNYFERMVNGVMFALDPFNTVDDDVYDPETRFRAEPIIVTVRQALVISGYQYIELTCKTVGVLPPGIVRGTYVLRFEDTGKHCYELPDEMFEDGEAPENELSLWHERANAEEP